MPPFDVTQPISAYSIHFFPPDATVSIFITVYKTGAATQEDVAGYLMFTDHPLVGSCRDRLMFETQSIVKHFPLCQFDAVQELLRHRIDGQKQGMSMHYVGDAETGGWTTLDAGASPGLDAALLPLVSSMAPKPTVATAAPPIVKKVMKKRKPGKK